MSLLKQLSSPVLLFNKSDSIRSFWIDLLIYAVVSFTIPFIVGYPQLLVGSIVNTILVLAALNLKTSHWLPIAVLPSLGVLARGLVWGPFMFYLVILLPFIWIANMLFIGMIQYFITQKQFRYWTGLLMASVVKASALGLVAVALFSFDLIPLPVLVFLSLLQLITALIGGILASGVQAARFGGSEH